MVSPSESSTALLGEIVFQAEWGIIIRSCHECIDLIPVDSTVLGEVSYLSTSEATTLGLELIMLSWGEPW